MDEPPLRPLGEPTVHLIARQFALLRAEVMADARTVASWTAPRDDLLLLLQRRHDWSRRAARRYLGVLRRALSRRVDAP